MPGVKYQTVAMLEILCWISNRWLVCHEGQLTPRSHLVSAEEAQYKQKQQELLSASVSLTKMLTSMHPCIHASMHP